MGLLFIDMMPQLVGHRGPSRTALSRALTSHPLERLTKFLCLKVKRSLKTTEAFSAPTFYSGLKESTDSMNGETDFFLPVSTGRVLSSIPS